VVLGLVVLLAAVVVGVAGVFNNLGSGHALTHGFSVLFGYHVTGSTGVLFLYGIVIGAAALLGLSLLLGTVRRTSRRGHAARRGLNDSGRHAATVYQDRDLVGEGPRAPRSARTRRRDLRPLAPTRRAELGKRVRPTATAIATGSLGRPSGPPRSRRGPDVNGFLNA
jgi:hypothetical protein